MSSNNGFGTALKMPRASQDGLLEGGNGTAQTYTSAHPCPDCDLCFATANFLAQHRRRHQCQLCDYSTGNSGHLKDHINAIHRKERPFKCEACGKAFVTKTELNIHSRTHTKERPYKCTHCDKAFTQTGNLRTHITTVHERLRYVCSECGKTFSQSATLRQHISTVHWGERKHVCTVCNARFVRSDVLRSHISVVHLGERKYACTVCSYRGGQSNQLKRHMKSKHGEHK